MMLLHRGFHQFFAAEGAGGFARPAQFHVRRQKFISVGPVAKATASGRGTAFLVWMPWFLLVRMLWFLAEGAAFLRQQLPAGVKVVVENMTQGSVGFVVRLGKVVATAGHAFRTELNVQHPLFKGVTLPAQVAGAWRQRARPMSIQFLHNPEQTRTVGTL